MAATQSPYPGSEPSTFSPGHSATTEPGTRKRKASHSLPRPAVREIGLMRDTGGKDSARFVGSSSGIHFIRNVHLRLARQSASRTHHTRGEAGGENDPRGIGELVPGEDDQLRRRATERDGARVCLWKDHEVSADEGQPPPSFDQLVEWSRSYFESWHPILPFLHGPDVLRYFEEVSRDGTSSLDHLDRCILRSVLSICLADSRQGAPLTTPIPASLLFGTVDEAVSSSQFALCQPASIRATQAALSIQLFLTSMLCLNAASRLGGLVVRMAFHLGLHRCPTRFPFFTPAQAALRRRLFWCIYCCERYLCQSLGLPLDIQDDDIDVCYPDEEEHSAGDEEGDKRLQLLTFMAKHAKIRGQILELRNKAIVTRQDTADRAIVVQTELSRWSNEIQDTVEEVELADKADAGGRPVMSSSHRLVLLLSKYESLISLNRPMMASDASTPSWSAAMQACISAAKSICIAMRRHTQTNRIVRDRNGHNLKEPMLWPSFTWAIWISAFVLAYAAFEQQMPLESALRHIESSKDVLRHIATRNTSWPEYCLSALDELTSAVKESSSMHSAIWNNQGTGVALHTVNSSGVARPLATNGVQRQAPTPSRATQQRKTSQGHTNPSDFPQVIASSPGVAEQGESEFPNRNSAHPQSVEWQRNGAGPPQAAPHYGGYAASPGLAGASQDTPWNYQQPLHGPGGGQFPSGMPHDGTQSGNRLIPGEGQESAMWYDQLFATSFSAIDDPFLAAAHLDPSIDPTWSYLR